MSFNPNPRKFVAGARVEAGRITFFDSSVVLSLVPRLDPQPMLDVDRAFRADRTDALHELNPDWWQLSPFAEEPGLTKLTFKGAAFSNHLKEQKTLEPTCREPGAERDRALYSAFLEAGMIVLEVPIGEKRAGLVLNLRYGAPDR